MRGNWRSLGMAAAVPLGAMVMAFAPVGPLPSVPGPAQLMAQGLYLRGTRIGGYTDDDRAFVGFANTVTRAVYGVAPFTVDDGDDPNTGDQVEYNAGFRPFSHGGFDDLTYGASVRQGLQHLSERVARERGVSSSADDPPDGDPLVVFGYSQGAVVVGQYKASQQDDDIVYILLSNPGRPNGGMITRFNGLTIPILDIPLSGPTPTTTDSWDGSSPTTYDITRQYDGWSDFPKYPLNLFATFNAILGMGYLHGSYEYEVGESAFAEDAENTDTHRRGDTVYYTIGTDLLPLLRPLEQLGVPRPILLAMDAPLRVIIEQAYDRRSGPGAISGASLSRPANPVTDVVNVLRAIPVGIDDGLQAAGLGRPLKTRRAGMYGVGGPAVTPPGELRESAPARAATDPSAGVDEPDQGTGPSQRRSRTASELRVHQIGAPATAEQPATTRPAANSSARAGVGNSGPSRSPASGGISR